MSKGIAVKRVLVITAVIILVLSAIGCVQSQPDVPRYTADQVVAEAQAEYRGYSRSKGEWTRVDAEASYRGNGVWSVEISAPKGYTLWAPGEPTRRVLYFHEDSGSFKTWP